MNKAKLGHVIGVCGLAVGALGAVATPAFTNQPRSTVTASTVADDTTARSITIHKYKQSTPSSADRTGTTADEADVPEGSEPLAGISFKITKITKKAGVKLDATDDTTFTTTSTTQTVTTGADGMVTADLGTGTSADGYYIVEELDNDAVTTKAAPFIVHVPLTTTDASSGDKSLTYDINVYPKNAVDDNANKLNPVKTLIGTDGKETSSESVKAGSDVSWNLTIDRPADIHGSEVEDEGTTSQSTPDGNGNTVTTTTKTWKKYASELEMVDVLDTTKMDYQGIDKVVISSPSSDPTTMIATALTEDTDYTVTTTDDATAKTKTVTVSLTAAGITKLAQAPKGSKVVATLKTKVLADDDAKVVNTFTTHYKGTMTPGSTTDTETIPDGNQPTVEYGNIDAQKTDEDGKAVAKATFKLYPTEEDAKAGTNAITDADGKDLTAVSDENGKVEFRGLEVDTSKNNTRDYYLVETDAPVGYDLNGQVFKVTAAQDTNGSVDSGIADDTNTYDAVIKDPDNMIPNLPLTGSQGRILFYALTTMLIVVGAGGVYIIKKRQQA